MGRLGSMEDEGARAARGAEEAGRILGRRAGSTSLPARAVGDGRRGEEDGVSGSG
jgi:hypothetical protein